MAYDIYKLLHVQQEGALVTAVVDAPPINVITGDLFGELAALAVELEADPAALVFVLKSADPDFFLAHFDVALLVAMADAPTPPSGDLNTYHDTCNRFQRMDKVTIAQIEGRVGGGGAELAMSFDMRFGVTDKTVINQMEVPIGILPGGTGTERLPRLIGPRPRHGSDPGRRRSRCRNRRNGLAKPRPARRPDRSSRLRPRTPHR